MPLSYRNTSGTEASLASHCIIKLFVVFDKHGNVNALKDELSNAVTNGHLEVFIPEIKQNNANIAAVV